MEGKNGSIPPKEKIIVIVLTAVITWLFSLLGIHGTVNVHTAKIEIVESAIQEIRQDIKLILKELKK